MKNEIIVLKIKSYIAEDDLDSALNELNFLAKNSKWFNEVILLSSRYNDIKRSIRRGVALNFDVNLEKNKLRNSILDLTDEIKLSYDFMDPENEDEIIEKEIIKKRNQIKESLLSLTDEISNTNNQSFSQDLLDHQNLNKNDKILVFCELIYNHSKEILKVNQSVLIPILQAYGEEENSKARINLLRRMTELFYGQSYRGDFKRWITFLDAKDKSRENELTDLISRLMDILQELFDVLYSYNDKIKLKPGKHYFTKLRRISNERLKKIIVDYLERLNQIVDDIGIITEKIKLLDNTAANKSYNDHSG